MTLQAQYFASILDFVQSESSDICVQLSHSIADWQTKVDLLKQQFNQLPHLAGDIVLGLSQADSKLDIEVVILYRGLVFPLVIDLDSEKYNEELKANIHQQARRLKECHIESKPKFIVPVQVAINATPQGGTITVSEDLVADTMCDTGEHLAALIEHFSNQYKDDQIILSDWLDSDYEII
ncbi:hypothetical protein OPW36_02970 [Vibrio europaeus]|uniref:Uncharacterized protein n=1 Tax=Vibrio europaeus TaxID=300876 RepID=A0AAE7DW86_9VIBR|nr:hypothetical protein [Vibrio europaeus]MDC5803805.1 hypothetical protein [Vibrio europaeus]MDC5810297.1 hypothetical protein [Vibrio europaeus]MDC5823678.1 hypothetical protein [Vibrio europaeus]MDC5828486.1 hypothetical protein [Vibrio europaeus]MDC5833410.1 hypothetical protein [Vibrio europaeus]